MNVTINKGQVLTSDLKAAIMLEAQQALAYLPAEDKVNLGLSLVAAPEIDNQNSVVAMAIETKKKLEEAEALIQTLNSQIAASGNANTGTTTP
tara:strand:+ start:4569 stop:4847 length:279 start_codon:yes stop_codon:yes gene_type:complete